MNKFNKNLLLTVALLGAAVGFGACSSASTNTVSTGNTGSNSNTVVVKPANTTAVETVNSKPANMTADARPTAKTDELASTDVSAGDKIGVPECDEYIAKYEACVTGKVPEAQRAAFNSSIETMRKGWKSAASNPQAKAALAGGCKQALTTAKQSMSAFSCDW